MCGEIIEKAEASAKSDNALEGDNSKLPLANGEPDSVIGRSDADDAADAAVTQKPELEPPTPVEVKGETASTPSLPSD